MICYDLRKYVEVSRNTFLKFMANIQFVMSTGRQGGSGHWLLVRTADGSGGNESEVNIKEPSPLGPRQVYGVIVHGDKSKLADRFLRLLGTIIQ